LVISAAGRTIELLSRFKPDRDLSRAAKLDELLKTRTLRGPGDRDSLQWAPRAQCLADRVYSLEQRH
jgi:hypothetical protein